MPSLTIWWPRKDASHPRGTPREFANGEFLRGGDGGSCTRVTTDDPTILVPMLSPLQIRVTR